MNAAYDPTFSEFTRAPSKHVPLHEPAGIINSSVSLTNLFDVIFRKLHSLFSLDCGVIMIYNDQTTVVRGAYISTYITDTEQINTETIVEPTELTGLQKTIAGFSFPVLKSKEEWIQEENMNHRLLNNDDRYERHCYIPLEINNRILGTLELHNYVEELSAECLIFCSNIADLVSDIIYIQPSQSHISNGHQPASDNTGHKMYSGGDSQKNLANHHLLSKLNEQLAKIKDIDTLDEFVNNAAQMFPAAYEKIKAQVSEVHAFKTLLEDASQHVSEDVQPSGNYPQIIGAGPGMNKVFALVDQVAGSESTVLIMGETGTGKELIARAIHEGSTRKEKAMITVNCAAIPTNLIESELFGHEKGAFTGATDLRIGKFEQADNGTLFLDEIGELPMDLQVKLLRVLQEKEIERVGGKTTIKTDVRVIAATNRDLLAEVEQGRFRRDLYYRLHVFPINLPPLRDRLEDIPLLASYFLAKYSKQQTGFSRRAIKQMSTYSWPGNIREMEHLIERQALLNTRAVISEINIPAITKTINDEDGMPRKIKTIDENERDHIFAVLQICNGRVSGVEGAAKLLGVPATTLNSKIKRLGLNKQHF
jgi:transcriptional regulator with GAF, ATPase, and Fis domain